jgi:hypothetical protein
VVAGAAYVYFADPLGIFPTGPLAVTPPPAPVAKPVAPVQPVAAVAAPQPPPLPVPEPAVVPEEPSPTPSVPDVQVPEVPEAPPPPPPPLPELQNVVSAFRIAGARASETGGMIMLGATPFQAGEVVDPVNNLVLVGFADGVMTFRDSRGALYRRRF